jgi:uncharacterized membrane protein YfcA
LIFAVGATLGLLGAGGTAIALPILVYVVGMEAHQAVTVSIILVGLVSFFGAALHHRQGNVRWRLCFAFAPSGVLGAWLGSKASYLLTPRALLLSFGALLAVISLRLLLEKKGRRPAPHAAHPAALAAAGFLIGCLTGLLGVGGGFVIVPALLWFGGLGMRQAVGSSLVIIGMNSAAALSGHLREQALPWGQAAGLLGSAGVGMAISIRQAQRIDAAKLKRWFAWLLLALAGYVLLRNLLGI